MYDVKGNLHEVLGSLPAGVRLVAISKFHPNEYIEEAYAEGQRIFGESHEQELAKKVASLPEDIEWHFIGHLQTNKVKYIAPYISMIESVDSLKLLKEIEKQAAKHNRVVKVLLELHLAEEDTKSGLSLDACRELLEAGEWREMKHVQICGIMMMASNTDDEQQIAQEFDEAAQFFDEIKARYFADDDAFCERSWGMSHDYHIAVKHGTVLAMQMEMCGLRLDKQQQDNEAIPVYKSRNTLLFAQLPEQFTLFDASRERGDGASRETIRKMISRWTKRGLCKKLKGGDTEIWQKLTLSA